MSDDRSARLESLLRLRGPSSAATIASALGISQPTVSRLIAAEGARVVRIGRARAARYASVHPVARAGSQWPLFRIDAEARPHTLGTLHSLANDHFWFDRADERPVFAFGEFTSGVYPGLPWFIDDQRPQGFLGRAFGRRVGPQIGARTDIAVWHRDEVVLALLLYGDDEPGDLVLGEASLQRAQQQILAPTNTIAMSERATRYPELAEAALMGDAVGSSAGGEHPKFAITLRDGDDCVPVIVKFSDRMASTAGQRWADLLVCEHLACETLRDHGLAAAASEVLVAGERRFLQSTRFDRTPTLGRRGFVSLAALDAAFFGHARIDWWRYAPELQRDGWLSPDDARRLRLYGWFGTLIGNTDMHLGNTGLHLADTRPLALAPIWDMLPMHWQPASNGEVMNREFRFALPTPEQRDDWTMAARMAIDFWHRVDVDTRISPGFRSVTADVAPRLERALDRHG